MNFYIKTALFFIVSMVFLEPAYGMARILGLYKHTKMRSSVTRMHSSKEIAISALPTLSNKPFDFKKNKHNYRNQSTSDQHHFNNENGKTLWMRSWATILSLFGLSSWISCQDNNDEKKQSNITNYIVKKLAEAKDNPEKLNALAHEILALKKEGKIVNVSALVEVIKKEFFSNNQLIVSESALINFFKIIAEHNEIKQELVETSEILFKANQYSLLSILGSATHDVGLTLAHLIANQTLEAHSIDLFQKIIKAHSAEIASFSESIERILNQPLNLQDYEIIDDYFQAKNNFSSFLTTLVHYSSIACIDTIFKKRFNALEQKINTLFSVAPNTNIDENDYVTIDTLSKQRSYHVLLQSLCSTLMTKALECNDTTFGQTFAAEQKGSLIPFLGIGFHYSLIKRHELESLFNKLIDNAHSLDYLTSLKNYASLSTAWHNYLLDHFETIIKKVPLIFGEIDDASTIEQCLEKLSSANLHTSENGLVVLKRCLSLAQINERFNQTFVSWIIKHASELNPIVVSHATACRPCSQELKDHINNASDKMIKLISYTNNCPQESSPVDVESLTAHERHILHNKNAINRGCTLAWFFDPALRNLYYRLNSKTKELENQGYYTFVHGQRWGTYLVEKWFTYLWELKNNKECPEYLFMHVNQQLSDNVKESELRQEILQNNPKYISLYRQRLLFMNWALFANSFFAASNTACFVAQNSNISHNVISLQKVFAYFDLDNVYNQFKKDFEELEKNHANASKYGNLALIAIPKDLLEKTVYPAESGGYKRQVEIDGKPTDNIRLIMDTAKTHPEKIENSDNLEFCMAMTSDIALNPQSGIKINFFNAPDKGKIIPVNYQEQFLREKVKETVHKN